MSSAAIKEEIVPCKTCSSEPYSTIESVSYGDELTGEYLANYNNIMDNLPIAEA